MLLKCPKCHNSKPSESFGKKRADEQNLVCNDCLQKKAESRRDKMAELATSTISLDQAFTQLIAADLNATVVVNLDDPVLQPFRHREHIHPSTLLPHVSNIAGQLWSKTGYRFVHNSSKDGTRSSSCSFLCAADIERSRKLSSEHRDRESMVRAPCESLLSFSFNHISQTLTIKARHQSVHQQYDLSVKPAIREFISCNIENCPSKLYRMIRSRVKLQQDAQHLTEHQVRYVWHTFTSGVWLRDSDPFLRPNYTQAKKRTLTRPF